MYIILFGVGGGGVWGAMSFRQPFLCFVKKRISDLSYASFLFCMLPFAGQHIFHQFRQTNFFPTFSTNFFFLTFMATTFIDISSSSHLLSAFTPIHSKQYFHLHQPFANVFTRYGSVGLARDRFLSCLTPL